MQINDDADRSATDVLQSYRECRARVMLANAGLLEVKAMEHPASPRKQAWEIQAKLLRMKASELLARSIGAAATNARGASAA